MATSKEKEIKPVEAVATAVAPTVAPKYDFTVADPQEYKPAELPLLIKPSKGEWANEAQATYAKTLNGYAYKNPKKWAVKKEALLANLKALETNPEKLGEIQGRSSNLTFGSKIGK